MNRSPVWSLSALILASLSSVSACAGTDEGPEAGDPCELDEDCGDELICDVHGDAGSCQTPHDH